MLIVLGLLAVDYATDRELFQQLLGVRGCLRLVRRYRHQLKALRSQLGLQADQLRQLGAARIAPSGPKIVEDHLTSVIADQLLESCFI